MGQTAPHSYTGGANASPGDGAGREKRIVKREENKAGGDFRKKIAACLGAGNRTRTCTLLAVEPKSTESTNSTMPAYHYIIQISRRLSIPSAVERKRTQKCRKRTKITSDFQKLESRISKFPKIRTIGQER